MNYRYSSDLLNEICQKFELETKVKMRSYMNLFDLKYQIKYSWCPKHLELVTFQGRL